MADPPILALSLEMDPKALCGLPLLVAVTARNVSGTVALTRFPPLQLLDPRPRIAFVLHGPEGSEEIWSAPSARGGEGPPEGVSLWPGAARRALVGLDGRWPELAPGRYRLRASVVTAGCVVESPPVSFEVGAVPEEERRFLRQLRQADPLGRGTWLAFARAYPREPALSGLSIPALEALAYHRFLHRAAFGPEPLSRIDPARMIAFDRGILAPEAAALRVELHAAAGRDARPESEAIRERWPGLAWRLDDIAAGRGRLTLLREFEGVESPDWPPRAPSPYGG
jgi:hypothetical protein